MKFTTLCLAALSSVSAFTAAPQNVRHCSLSHRNSLTATLTIHPLLPHQTQTHTPQPRTSTTSLNVWGDKDYLIAPSILSADFAQLGAEVDNVLEAGADVVHFDVMDNHYVPNLTIGPMVCKALRDHGVTAPIDVHLMVSPVDAAISDFIDAGASYITFHPEATSHVDRSLQLIKNGGCKAGLVFNPATSLDAAKYVTDKLDIILLMSVNPGFGGQAFIPAVLDKAREARKLIDEAGIDCRLEIDGGVKVDNIKEICEAGVDMFVAGSAILKEPRTVEAYKATIDEMREELASAKVNGAAEPVAA